MVSGVVSDVVRVFLRGCLVDASQNGLQIADRRSALPEVASSHFFFYGCRTNWLECSLLCNVGAI